MAGIGLLKLVMIGFIAPPILFWLLLPAGSRGSGLACLVPSVPAFRGIIELLEGGSFPAVYILLLSVHCVVWLVVYLWTEMAGEKKKRCKGGKLA